MGDTEEDNLYDIKTKASEERFLKLRQKSFYDHRAYLAEVEKSRVKSLELMRKLTDEMTDKLITLPPGTSVTTSVSPMAAALQESNYFGGDVNLNQLPNSKEECQKWAAALLALTNRVANEYSNKASLKSAENDRLKELVDAMHYDFTTRTVSITEAELALIRFKVRDGHVVEESE